MFHHKDPATIHDISAYQYIESAIQTVPSIFNVRSFLQFIRKGSEIRLKHCVIFLDSDSLKI